jgi:hypothetical protein
MLVREVSYASGVRLAETGLLLATRGFNAMERTELTELGRLFEQLYATLPRADHEWMTEYMRTVRDGTLDAEASARGRRLLTQGVERLPSAGRERLQALLEKAIRAGIEARRESEARTQQAVLTAPPPLPAAPAPALDRRLSASATPAPSAESLEAPGAGGSNARGEAYWRSRMQRARARVASLKAQIARLEQTVNREVYGPTVQPRCHAPERITNESQQAFLNCAQSVQNWPTQQSAVQAARLAELEQLREQLKLAERWIIDIEDEARQAGALPGWLRD